MLAESYLINIINDYINNNLNKNKEHYIVEHFSDYKKYFYSLVWFCINCAAVYLSWNCNSNKNLNLGLRIIYALIAYFFGIFYIIFNGVLFKSCYT